VEGAQCRAQFINIRSLDHRSRNSVKAGTSPATSWLCKSSESAVIPPFVKAAHFRMARKLIDVDKIRLNITRFIAAKATESG
jgi:hypothetical protein